MGNPILTGQQQQFLSLFSQNKDLVKTFYLTGGTALSEYYLFHRKSEDLDFFTEEEVEILQIQVFLKDIQKSLHFEKVDFVTSFNRNLAYLYFPQNYILKTEFTHFPFPQIEKGTIRGGIRIDSLLDIAVNKLFTIYQKPRIRDFIDLYFIVKEKDWSLEELAGKARIKFDWHIDYIQLGAQLLEVKNLLEVDYPVMLVDIDKHRLQQFFFEEAKKLKNKVLE